MGCVSVWGDVWVVGMDPGMGCVSVWGDVWVVGMDPGMGCGRCVDGK